MSLADPLTNYERARRYIDKMEPAISGQRGHDATISVACRAVEFGLTPDEVWSLLLEYNERCQPPWSERELRHKLEDAFRLAKPDPRKASGYVQPPRPGTTAFATVTPAAAPVPAPEYPVTDGDLPEPIVNGAIELLRSCFRPDEGVRVCPARLNEEGREVPADEGITLTAAQWIERWSRGGGSPHVDFMSSQGAGIYIAINPVKLGGSRDSDVTAYRHALLEFDGRLTPAEQLSLYRASNLPCAAVIYSGGKSMHAWVRVDAKDRREYDERVRLLYEHFSRYTPDPKNKNPGRLSRLPNVERLGKRQELLAINIGAESWSAWTMELGAAALPKPHRFKRLLSVDTSNDPHCVIGIREGRTLRYLCKGKSAWLIGPSGIGKSSLITEFAIGWALGQPVFGIAPVKPLKSLIVQAENDEYDLAEQAQGIARAYLRDGADDFMADVIDERVIWQTETTATHAEFVKRLHRYIDRDKPDVVWIDPLLSFAGIDVSKQDQVSMFLRGLLNPMLEATGVVLIGVHHVGKPRARKDVEDWTDIDWAYQGLGSSELVNWARAVLTLRPSVPSGVFELKLAKRGGRAGATHPNGEPTTGLWIRHARGSIRWEQIDPPEEPVGVPEGRAPRKTVAQEYAERPDIREVLLGIPDEGESGRALGARLFEHARKVRMAGKISESTCRKAVLNWLSDAGKIVWDEGTQTWRRGPNV